MVDQGGVGSKRPLPKMAWDAFAKERLVGVNDIESGFLTNNSFSEKSFISEYGFKGIKSIPLKVLLLKSFVNIL